MTTVGEILMKKIRAWFKGEKHPDTPKTVFMNVWGCDLARRVLKGRCAVCDHVVSSDPNNVKELIFACDGIKCKCDPIVVTLTGLKAHDVCDVCDAMFRSLYINWGLENKNYYKEWDEREKRDRDDARRKGGLS